MSIGSFEAHLGPRLLSYSCTVPANVRGATGFWHHRICTCHQQQMSQGVADDCHRYETRSNKKTVKKGDPLATFTNCAGPKAKPKELCPVVFPAPPWTADGRAGQLQSLF